MILDDVGVVAIGRNEGARLVECLESVRSVTANIVYVDSGSTDDSVLAAERRGALVVVLDMTRPFTAARARNEGFAALGTRWPHIRFVQFIDGDCILIRSWLEKAIAFLDQREDVAVVCGRRRERHPTASIYNQFFDIEWNTPLGETLACGGDALMREEAVRAVGGFRSQLIAGEEPELCARLREAGWKIWRLDAEMTLHDAAMRHLGQWWTRAVRSGYGATEVSRLHQHSPFSRGTLSAIVWGGLIPLAIILGALVEPLFLGVGLIYPIQICRIAVSMGARRSISWKYATFVMLAKIAQAQGISKFYWYWWRGKTSGLIEYKK